MRPIFLNRASRIDHITIRRSSLSKLRAWLESIGFVLVVGVLNGMIGG